MRLDWSRVSDGYPADDFSTCDRFDLASQGEGSAAASPFLIRQEDCNIKTLMIKSINLHITHLYYFASTCTQVHNFISSSNNITTIISNNIKYKIPYNI